MFISCSENILGQKCWKMAIKYPPYVECVEEIWLGFDIHPKNLSNSTCVQNHLRMVPNKPFPPLRMNARQRLRCRNTPNGGFTLVSGVYQPFRLCQKINPLDEHLCDVQMQKLRNRILRIHHLKEEFSIRPFENDSSCKQLCRCKLNKKYFSWLVIPGSVGKSIDIDNLEVNVEREKIVMSMWDFDGQNHVMLMGNFN